MYNLPAIANVVSIASAIGLLAMQLMRRQRMRRISSMPQQFSDEAAALLEQAQVEARTLGHPYVGTEHVLLALIASPSSSGAQLLHKLGVDSAEIRQRVLAQLETGVDTREQITLPYTARAHKALEEALFETAQAQRTQVGAAELLIGLLREKNGIAAHTLAELGITLTDSRRLQP